LPTSQSSQWAFCKGAGGLKKLDLSPFAHVTELGEGFLKGCSGLKKLDLSPFADVTELPVGFLQELDMKELGMKKVTVRPLVEGLDYGVHCQVILR
jgi:hypothetical protein